MPSRKSLILLCLLLVMEFLAGWTVVVGTSLLDATTTGYSTFWLLLLEGAAGMVAGLLIAAYGPGDPWNRRLFLAGGIVAVGIVTALVSHSGTSAFVTALLLGVAFWRGLVLTQEPPGYDEVQGRFGLGLGVLFLGIVWVLARGILEQATVWHMIAFTGIGYTLVALVALGIARVSDTQEPGAVAALVMAVGAQVLIIGIIALLAIQIFSVNVMGGLYDLTRPFWDVVGTAVHSIVLALAAPLQWLIDQIQPHGHAARIRQPGKVNPGTPDTHKLKQHERKGNPFVSIGALAVGALLLAGIAYLVWRSIPHIPKRTRQREFRDERRQLLTPAEMLTLFLSWLRSLLARGVDATVHAGERARRAVLGPEYHQDPVRRLYAQLLHRAESVGVPRPAAVTPAEFGSQLALRWPEGAPEFARITDAYEARRYGGMPADEGTVDALRASWQSVRNLMRHAEPAVVAATDGAAPAAVPQRRLPAWMHRPELRESGLAMSLGIVGLSLLAPLVILLVLIVFIVAITRIMDSGSHPAAVPAYVTTPSGLAIDSRGYLYDTETAHGRVEKMTSSGRVVARFGGPGQLRGPQGITIDAAGNVFVADTGNHRVEEFSPSGRLRAVYRGRGGITLDRPYAVAVSPKGTIYVSDEGHDQIVVFSPRGYVLATWGQRGNGPGALSSPHGIALDRLGKLYVADGSNHRIEVFSSDGRALRVWPTIETPQSMNEQPGPTLLTVGPNGDVYLVDVATDARRYTVQVFSPTGRLLQFWGTTGTQPGQLDTPDGIAVDARGHVFVADSGNHRIQEFSPSGLPLKSWRTYRAPATPAANQGSQH